MLSLSLRRGVVAVAAVGALLGAGVALAGAEGPDESAVQARAAMAPAVPTVAVAELPAAVVERFALFRERAASAMPEDAIEQVGSPVRYGRNASYARAIETVTGTGWVIPGDGFLCIAVPDPVDGYGTSCVPTDVAVERGLAISLVGNLPDGKAADTLVVPDGQRAVRGPDGQERAVDADRGVVSVWSDAPGDLRVAGG